MSGIRRWLKAVEADWFLHWFVFGIFTVGVLFGSILALAGEPPQTQKSLSGRVLRATIWSQGMGQVVRITYQGDTLPDSISVEIAVSQGDTARVVYKVPVDPAYDRALHEIYEGTK